MKKLERHVRIFIVKGNVYIVNKNDENIAFKSDVSLSSNIDRLYLYCDKNEVAKIIDMLENNDISLFSDVKACNDGIDKTYTKLSHINKYVNDDFITLDTKAIKSVSHLVDRYDYKDIYNYLWFMPELGYIGTDSRRAEIALTADSFENQFTIYKGLIDCLYKNSIIEYNAVGGVCKVDNYYSTSLDNMNGNLLPDIKRVIPVNGITYNYMKIPDTKKLTELSKKYKECDYLSVTFIGNNKIEVYDNTVFLEVVDFNYEYNYEYTMKFDVNFIVDFFKQEKNRTGFIIDQSKPIFSYSDKFIGVTMGRVNAEQKPIK